MHEDLSERGLFCPFWPLTASTVHSLRQNCAARLILKQQQQKSRKTDQITPLFQFLHWPPTQQSSQYEMNTLCYTCITGTALSDLCDSTVFNFTHPPILSALLVMFSASKFLAPDSPLLVPAPFQFSVHLHGMTFPFLSDRNPLWTLSDVT